MQKIIVLVFLSCFILNQDAFTVHITLFKISSVVFYKIFGSFCLKQAEISANGVRKIIIIQRLNTIIFLTPLADISSCYKQKLTTF